MITLRSVSCTLLSLAGALVLVRGAHAQGTGSVSGRVLATTTNQPIAAARVTVVGAGRGALTRANGEYVLREVPVGTQQVRVQVIGYRTTTLEITVAPGETATLDFALAQVAIALDEVVVTGTAMEVERRMIGNDLARITADQIAAAPTLDLADVLQGRSPGVIIMDNSGQAGAGSTIRLRGVTSLSQGSTPLIYVDGVRMTNRPYEGADEAAQAPSPLNDINPADIERVEIVKGAAATTLYGTEASAGVVQVFTKRGSSGEALWSLSLDQGFSRMGHVGPDEDPTGLWLNDCRSQPGCPPSGSWFSAGHLQRYNLSVRGGGDQLNYFISGRWTEEEGVIEPQGTKDWGFRANFGFSASPEMVVTFSNNYARRHTRWIPDGDNREGFLLNVIRGPQGYTPGNDDSGILEMQLDQRSDHFTSGLTVAWNPTRSFSHRLTAGLDYARSDYEEEHPFGYVLEPEGSREDDQSEMRTLTLDYAGTWQASVGSSLTSSFTFGGQLFSESTVRLNGFGEIFAVTGEKVVESGALTEAFEGRLNVTNGGFFLQEMVGWQDRAFLTLGLRVDGHSSFGEDFGLVPYPKVSLSYVISEANFWPTWWESLKLRAAFGVSGKAPGVFDKLKTWNEVSGDEGQPAVSPANLGNPDLGPERTREVEAGLEGSLFDGRLGINFTAYAQRTYDALVPVQRPPSLGFIQSQLENVGALENRGVEASADFRVLRTPTFAWDLGFRYAANRSKALDLGGLPLIDLPWRQEIRPGDPVPSFYHDVVVNGDQVGVTPIFEKRYLGPTLPQHTYGISTTISVGSRLTLDVLGEGQGGHVMSAGTAYQNVRRSVWPTCTAIQEQIAAGDTATLTAWQRARCDTRYVTYGMWIDPADFFKLRSISLSYRLPATLLVGGIRAATLRLQARNLFSATKFPGLDPEASQQGSSDVLWRQEYYNLPPPRLFLASLRVDF